MSSRPRGHASIPLTTIFSVLVLPLIARMGRGYARRAPKALGGQLLSSRDDDSGR